MTRTAPTSQFVYVDSDVPAGMTLSEWRRRDMVDLHVARRSALSQLRGLGRRTRRRSRPALAFA